VSRDLSEDQWQALASAFGTLAMRGPRGDVRGFFEAVNWILRSGAPWRDLAKRYGNWEGIYRRYRRWAIAGRWEALRLALERRRATRGRCPRMLVLIDSTIVKAHAHAAGASKASGGQQVEALGRSRGGFTTKLHAVVSSRGELVRYRLTGGEVADITQAAALVRARDGRAVVGDRAYDSDAFLEHVRSLDMRAVVPPRRHRKVQRRLDRGAYARRNVVERWFGRITVFRRIATRYEKTERSYAGFVSFATMLVAVSGWS
jgi:transposase